MYLSPTVMRGESPCMGGPRRPAFNHGQARPASACCILMSNTTFDVKSGLGWRQTFCQDRPHIGLGSAMKRIGYSNVADSARARTSSTSSTGVDGEYVASRITIDPFTSRIHSSSIWPAPWAFRAGSVSPATP